MREKSEIVGISAERAGHQDFVRKKHTLFLSVLCIAMIGLVLMAAIRFPTTAFAGTNVLFSDNFDDGDLTGWTIINGKWQVSSGECTQIDESKWPTITWAGDKAWTDYTVEVDVKSKGGVGHVFILFRFLDDKNFYLFGIRETNDNVVWNTCFNGAWGKEISKPKTIEKDKWYHLKVEVQGDVIKGYVDNTLYIEALGAGLKAGAIALDTHVSSGNFDNVSVLGYVAEVVRFGKENYEGFVGQKIPVDVVVDGANSVAGGYLEVSFDSIIVNAISVAAGDYGTPVYTIDNTRGLVKVTVALAEAPDKSSAILVKITFKALVKGESVLALYAELNDEQGKLVFPKTQNGRITVNQWIKGDVNHNGRLDTGDATLVLRMIVGLESVNMLGDMNNNDLIDTGDATIIQQKVIGT